jgi:hypothetical protein
MKMKNEDENEKWKENERKMKGKWKENERKMHTKWKQRINGGTDISGIYSA